MSRSAADYLKLPYGRLLMPEDDGTYRAEMIEFPGCFAVGETAAEAAENLEDAATGWIDANLVRGRAIPDPMEENDYSGKLVLRLPKSMHKASAYAANRDGVSLNNFIVTCIAEKIGAYRASVFNAHRNSVSFTVTVSTANKHSGFLSASFGEDIGKAISSAGQTFRLPNQLLLTDLR